MAISWGPWSYASGNGMRLGIDVSTSAVTSSSSSVTFTWKIWRQNQYQYSDNQTLSWSGAASGSTSVSNNGGSGSQTLIRTITTSYTYTSSGSSPGTRYLSASLSGAYNGSTPSVTVSKAIPARPTGTPSAPTIGSTTRNSDSSFTVRWTNNTSAASYSSVTVQILINGTGSWSTVGTAGGSASSYTYTGSRPNSRVQFRVRANNSAGSSAWTGSSPYLYTTPAAPSNVVARLNSSGQIAITWSKNVGWEASLGAVGYNQPVQRSTNGGSSWTTLSAGVGPGYSGYTDASPYAGSAIYRVAIKAADTSGNTGPQSAWVSSNSISPETPSLAPTYLSSPNGSTVDPASGVKLQFQYNPGADNADFSALDLSWTALSEGDATTHTGVTVTGVSVNDSTNVVTFTVPASTFPSNDRVQWRVRTYGAHPDPGPWSAWSSVFTRAPAAVNVTGPESPVTGLPVVVTWDYSQADGQPAGAWEVSLYDSTGTSLLGSWKTGVYPGISAPQTSFSIPFTFTDGASYQVAVTTRPDKPIWTTSERLIFSVAYLDPAQVSVTPTLYPDIGMIGLDLSTTNAVPGVSSAVVSVDVQRRIDEGEWTTILAGIAIDADHPTSVVDILPTLNGTNTYRLVVFSSIPSQALQDEIPVVVAGFQDVGWAFINWGDNLDQVLRGRCDPALSETRSRAKEVHAAAGRRWPLVLIGDSRSSQIQVSLTVETGSGGSYDCPFISGWEHPNDVTWNPVYGSRILSSNPREWLDMGENATYVVYRDWTGRRAFGVVEDVTVADKSDTVSLAAVSFTVTRTWWDEGVPPTVLPAPDDEDN